MSSVNLYFIIPTTLIAIILLVDSITARRMEQVDFRKKVPNEALAILNELASRPTRSHIPCTVWSSKTEELKTDVLGAKDYMLWKQFYDNVEVRNEFFGSREGFSWSDVEKFNSLCFDSFLEVYEGVSWVKGSIPQERIADLLSRAERSAALSRSSAFWGR